MIRAQYPTFCWRCDTPINPGDPIIKRGPRWYCTACAGGADDE